jgi:hypothetical protein
VILGLGTSGAVIGYTISSVFAGLTGMLFVWISTRIFLGQVLLNCK